MAVRLGGRQLAVGGHLGFGSSQGCLRCAESLLGLLQLLSGGVLGLVRHGLGFGIAGVQRGATLRQVLDPVDQVHAGELFHLLVQRGGAEGQDTCGITLLGLDEQVPVLGRQAEQLFDRSGHRGVAVGHQLFAAGELGGGHVASEDVSITLDEEVQLQAELGLSPGWDLLFLARHDGDAEQRCFDGLQQGGLAAGVLAGDDVQPFGELGGEVTQLLEVLGSELYQAHGTLQYSAVSEVSVVWCKCEGTC
ncbi:hypothetical protein D3C85_1087010 [compost metagenome]